MARNTAKKADHLMYIGAHPHVGVREVAGIAIGAEFPRGEAVGPFDEDVIVELTKKEGEFVRCAAPEKSADTNNNSTTEGGIES
jgi:hypothetical protein